MEHAISRIDLLEKRVLVLEQQNIELKLRERNMIRQDCPVVEQHVPISQKTQIKEESVPEVSLLFQETSL